VSYIKKGGGQKVSQAEKNSQGTHKLLWTAASLDYS
jgi:hypothetical protein